LLETISLSSTSLREFLVSLDAEEAAKQEDHLPPLELPFLCIGTDEVGKGDYFGRLSLQGH